MNYDKCPNCGKSFIGFLSADLLPQSKIDFINKNLNDNKSAYCTACSKKLLDKIAQEYKQQKHEIEERLKQIISSIPITTSPSPTNWKYEIIGMISTQNTAGTGFATELSQSVNDFFGRGSNKTNKKISNATIRCKIDLRLRCAKAGGNAIISTDIDFSEIGTGNTNMLMVCMAGTAIRITDMNSFNVRGKDNIVEIMDLTEKLSAISNID